MGIAALAQFFTATGLLSAIMVGPLSLSDADIAILGASGLVLLAITVLAISPDRSERRSSERDVRLLAGSTRDDRSASHVHESSQRERAA
jgi:hypothetical protein